MGMFGDIFGGFGDYAEGIGKIFEAKDRKNAALVNEAQYYVDQGTQDTREKALDYDPAYVGDSIGPYQRSSSPVARSYLESLVTGQNKQAASSPWADPTAGQRAENAFERTYGPYDALVARGARERKATPWKTTNPRGIDTSANDVENKRVVWKGG